MVILSGENASADEGPACDCNKRQMYIPALAAGIYAPNSALCNFRSEGYSSSYIFCKDPIKIKI